MRHDASRWFVRRGRSLCRYRRCLVDPDIVDIHLVVEAAVRDVLVATQGATDRDVHDDVHRVVVGPVIVGRTRWLVVGQVGVENDPAIDTELHRVRVSTTAGRCASHRPDCRSCPPT